MYYYVSLASSRLIGVVMICRFRAIDFSINTTFLFADIRATINLFRHLADFCVFVSQSVRS